MKKRTQILGILLLLSLNAVSQISFSNQTSALIADTTVYSGVAIGIADMNGDSLDDILRLKNARILYIEYQQADGSTFEQYLHGTMGSGSQWGMCVADVDGNGYNDIIAGGNHNDLKLLKANSTGDAYTQTNISNPQVFLQAINFADIDNNGTTDIFACHDVGLSAPFSNDGSGNFSHDTNLIHAAADDDNTDHSGNYGSVWTDYDNDGDLDLFISKCRLGVSNPADPRRENLLMQNDGTNDYTDVASAAGLRPGAQTWATDFGDIDNDGDLDAFMINHDMTSQIYKNNGDGTFTDETSNTGISGDLAAVSGGIQGIFDDFDNDGYIDILMTALSGTHRLYINNGDFTFTIASNPFPTNGLGIQSAVTGDLNNDGYLDVFAAFANGYNGPNSNRPDKVYINEESGFNYLKLLLSGANGNHNAIGTRVEAYGDWGIQVREIRSGESYGIMNSFALHFGLGAATVVDSLKIRWPNGTTEMMCGIAVNQQLVMTENNLPALLNSDFDFTNVDHNTNFEDLSEGIADDWNWDFGDGNTSTEQNPTHVYVGDGPHTVTLTISNNCETSVFSQVWTRENPLPLDLLEFSANLFDQDKVALQWRTENEFNFAHFELQRSKDLNNIEKLATIEGKNAEATNQYEWIDDDPESGNNYYRLKMVDRNGDYQYGDWVNVAFESATDFTEIVIYPNPAKNELRVRAGTVLLKSVLIYNSTGQIIFEKNESTGDFDLNLQSWSRGIYFIRLSNDERSVSLKFNKL